MKVLKKVLRWGYLKAVQKALCWASLQKFNKLQHQHNVKEVYLTGGAQSLAIIGSYGCSNKNCRCRACIIVLLQILRNLLVGGCVGAGVGILVGLDEGSGEGVALGDAIEITKNNKHVMV